jgi:basic membrane protein A
MKKTVYVLFVSLMPLFLSCSKDEEFEQVESQETKKDEIVVIFTPNGLGDLGYNDLILSGMQSVYKEHLEVKMFLHAPYSMEEAGQIFKEWFFDGSENRSLCVLAASEYEFFLKTFLEEQGDVPKNKEILLFESANRMELPVSTFEFNMYGASYLVGAYASYMTDGECLIVKGNSNDETLRANTAGFVEGCVDFGLKKPEIESLSEDYDGYSQPDEVYHKMYDWSKKYKFIFPLAGGSNMGIYKFLREYEDCIYSVGMDVDQSRLSDNVIGSVIKRIDKVVALNVENWIIGEAIPKKAVYGLNSGFVDWVVADGYKDLQNMNVSNLKDLAIKKELEYEK